MKIPNNISKYLQQELRQKARDSAKGWYDIIKTDARYLPPLKSGQYGVNRARRSIFRQAKVWQTTNPIRRAFWLRNLTGATAKTELTRMVKKTRKKSGKTYYQRLKAADPIIKAVTTIGPLTAKRYIKGVDFNYQKF